MLKLTAFYILAFLLFAMHTAMPENVYWIAWFTSIVIYILTLFKKLIPIPNDMPVSQQLFRPYFLAHSFFFGYVCFSSVFYFLNLKGYRFFELVGDPGFQNDQVVNVAKCQCFYLIAHISLLVGMSVDFRKKGRELKNIDKSKLTLIILITAISAQIVVLFSSLIPGLSQIVVKFGTISQIASVLFLGFAIKEKNNKLIPLGLIIFSISMVLAVLSGWKSQVLFVLILTGFFLFPFYKKTIVILGTITAIFWLNFGPIFSGYYRTLNWYEEVASSDAFEMSVEYTVNSTADERDDATWSLLVDRLSEVGMFILFTEQVPAYRPYYGFEIINQVFYSFIPRILWPDKPDLELLIMQRVYENGVIDENSDVSAKPAFIVDSYLTAGITGIIVAHLILGLLNSFLYTKAEEWLGGYYLGTCIFFNGLFSIIWLGNSFEFMVNAVFWSFIVMLVLKFLSDRFSLFN